LISTLDIGVTVTGTASHETKAEENKEGQVENASGKRRFGNLNCSGRENG